MIVGYNDNATVPYWNVQNTWTSSWGLQGYVWIAKSTQKKGPGICGIAMETQYPIY